MIYPDQRIFASYAREDRAIALPLLALLRSANEGTFLDLDRILPGNRWPERLAAALAEAGTFVVFWSRHALQSESTNGEWKSALAAEKEIVTVRLDSTPLPEPLQACPSVPLKDLMAMKGHRGAQTTAGICAALLLIAAVAIPLASLKPELWHPQPPSAQPPATELNLADAPTPTATPAPAAPAADGDRDTRVRELLSKGRQLREGGASPAAIEQFQQAATLDDHNPVPFVELAVTSENAGLPQEALTHWQRIYDLGSGAGLYFSLAEAKLKAANALKRPGEAGKGAQDSPDLTAPVEGIASGCLLGLLPITREDQLDGKSSAHFLLHIPVKARPKARIDVHELIIHVLFYEFVDGKRIEETTANIKSHWLNPPADWVGSDTEQLEIEYQLPKAPTVADEIVDRKYYGYIIRVYYQELLQSSVAEPAGLARLHPPPPTVTGEPPKPPPPPTTPPPLPQGAFHHGSSIGLTGPAAAANTTGAPNPTAPAESATASPTPTTAPDAGATHSWRSWLPFLSSALMACLGLGSLLGLRIARRRHRQLEALIIELAARRVAATLAQPTIEPTSSEEGLVIETDTPAPVPDEGILPAASAGEEEGATSEAEPGRNDETPIATATDESDPALEDAAAVTAEPGDTVHGADEVEATPEKPSQG